MDITIIAIFALIAFMLYLFLNSESTTDNLKNQKTRIEIEREEFLLYTQKNEYRENSEYRKALLLLDLENKRVDLVLKKNYAIIQQTAQLNSHQLEVMRLEQNNRNYISEQEMRYYQIDREYAIRELEQRNITIGHYVALAKEKNTNAQDMILKKIKATKKFAEAQVKSMEYMDASEARQFKKNFLNKIDNNLDEINRDLDAAW